MFAKKIDLFETWDDLKDKGLLSVSEISDAEGSRFADPGDRYLAVFGNGQSMTFPEGARGPGHIKPYAPVLSAEDVNNWLRRGDVLVTEHPEWMRKLLLEAINETHHKTFNRYLTDTGMAELSPPGTQQRIDDIRRISLKSFDRHKPEDLVVPAAMTP